MRENMLNEMVDELRQIAIRYSNNPSLQKRLYKCVTDYLNRDKIYKQQRAEIDHMVKHLQLVEPKVTVNRKPAPPPPPRDDFTTPPPPIFLWCYYAMVFGGLIYLIYKIMA